jgi:hypothetical protein
LWLFISVRSRAALTSLPNYLIFKATAFFSVKCSLFCCFEPGTLKDFDSLQLYLSPSQLAVFASSIMASGAVNGSETLPNDLVGWQENSDRRGTLEILFSCLVTILACTWSVQHLNLPARKDTWLQRGLRKIWWTLITILFPELLLALGWAEFRAALRSMDTMYECTKFQNRKTGLAVLSEMDISQKA